MGNFFLSNHLTGRITRQPGWDFSRFLTVKAHLDQQLLEGTEDDRFPIYPHRGLRDARHYQMRVDVGYSRMTSVITKDLVTKGIQRSIDSKISFRDGLIVEAALEEGADILVTEDLQVGWET